VGERKERAAYLNREFHGTDTAVETGEAVMWD